MGGVVNSAAGFLGMGGDGKGFGPQTGNPAIGQLQQYNNIANNPTYNETMMDYLSGKRDSGNALQYLTEQQFHPDQQNNVLRFATDPISGSRLATDEVQGNKILGGLFGKGGQLENAENDYNTLSKQGFNLTPEDRTAYGQISGDIARQFGSQEQGLSQSLADRGLASAPSGAAGVGFSGIQGNKNEMLAKAQQDIANQRMQTTMQRLGQLQNFIGGLGSQGSEAVNQQYGRQLAGSGQLLGSLTNSGSLLNQSNSVANNANQANQSMMNATKPKNFMDFTTAGVGQGIQSQMSGGMGGIGGGSGFGGFGGS